MEVFDSEKPDKGWKQSKQFSLPVRKSSASRAPFFVHHDLEMIPIISETVN